MKYDRPVWQIMHECADAMPDVFRYEDVRNWFDAHYPDVNEATIRAHLIGLTEGGRAKHVQFAQRSPIFRRVARGEYESIPIAERGEDPHGAAPSASQIKMSGNGAHKTNQAAVPMTVPETDVDGASSSDAGDESVSDHGPDTVTHPSALPADAPSKKPPATLSAVPALDPEPSARPESQPEPALELQPTAEPDPADDTPAPLVDEEPPHEETADEATETADEIELPTPDVILLGSVGDRVNVPAPAKEVFREVAFQLSRLDAELSGSEWFVLSAEHGLVAPNEWMSPDSRTLADMDPDYRVTWASWVVARLQSLVGSLDGMFVRVDAPDAFIGPLFADLQDAGAIVSSGTVGVTVPPLASRHIEASSIARQLAGSLTPDHHEVPVAAASADYFIGLDEQPDNVSTLHEVDEIAEVLPLDPAMSATLHLSDLRHAIPATEVSSLPDTPGLYAWFVDPIGARELNRCLMLPVRAGLVFVGQIGGSSWQSLADPVLNLRDHIDRVQLHGRARASTFRMTLATVLTDYLRMTSLEDPRLTDWMLEHLSISYWPSNDLGDLREMEQVAITELDPPLNVDHLAASEYRTRLSQMRGAVS